MPGDSLTREQLLGGGLEVSSGGFSMPTTTDVSGNRGTPSALEQVQLGAIASSTTSRNDTRGRTFSRG